MDILRIQLYIVSVFIYFLYSLIKVFSFLLDFWNFSWSTFSVNSMLLLRSFVSVFTDLISFIVISRLPLIRLSKCFCCFSDSSLNISLIKVVNLSSLKYVLSLLFAILNKRSFKRFLAKVYLCALGQHCASNYLVQCCLRCIWITLTIFLCNIVPA